MSSIVTPTDGTGARSAPALKPSVTRPSKADAASVTVKVQQKVGTTVSKTLLKKVAIITGVLAVVGAAVRIVVTVKTGSSNTVKPFFSSSIDQQLQWSDELEYDYAKSLYENAGVPFDFPVNQTVRFVNVFIDLMVLPRSSNWVRSIRDDLDDRIVGRYCRSGLRFKKDKQLAELENFLASHRAFSLRGVEINKFVRDQENCRLNEISEAVMCLKGHDAEKLMSMAGTNINPSYLPVLKALRKWQDKVMPDLTQCLERRQQLMQTQTKEDALLQLSHELAKNYSIIEDGYAGMANLNQLVNQTKQLKNGNISFTQNISHVISGYPPHDDWGVAVNALTALAETLDACARAVDRVLSLAHIHSTRRLCPKTKCGHYQVSSLNKMRNITPVKKKLKQNQTQTSKLLVRGVRWLRSRKNRKQKKKKKKTKLKVNRNSS